MKIQKRDNRLENLSFDKIVYRLKKLAGDKVLGALKSIDTDIIAQKVVSTIYDGVTSTELDEEAARIAVSKTENLEFGKLASRIVISNLHKNTTECFSEVMEKLYGHTDSNGKPAPVLADDIIELVRKHKDILNETIDYTRDYMFDYFGYKTLEKSYLMRLEGKVVERPQHLYMRVSIQVHKADIENVIKTYHLISQHFFTFASPTMFNSGSRLQNLSSCFLLGTHDSIGGIFKTITDCAHISKVGGGIGVHINNVRSKGSVIRGTNGYTDGIVPMLKVYNETCKYVNQSSKRKGSFAMYLSPEHPDIFEFLDLRKNQGSEDMRARDLFLAMWISDLFMKQVESDGDWYLMDPDECPGLVDAYGDEFETLYWKYVEDKKYRKQVKAQDIWMRILESQIETGTPYILFKDQINKKSNQKNIGTIKSSNLCAEIALYSDDKEYACCFTGDTQILTKEGYRRIDECDNKLVLSYFDNDKQMIEKQQFVQAKLINNGKKDVYEMTCDSTKPIKATGDHLFAVLHSRNNKTKINTYCWKELKQLTKEDKIILPKTGTLPGFDKNISEYLDEDYLTVGWMVGDGWQSKTVNMPYPVYGVCFGPNECFARDRVTKKLLEWNELAGFKTNGHLKKTTEYHTDKNGVFSWSSSKQNFVAYIQTEYGVMPKTAHFKCIPDKIKLATPPKLASFLSGLFSADGSVYIKITTKRTRFNVNLASSSKYLLDDVQQMLKCFGIESRTCFGDVKGRKDKQGKLSIENKDSLNNFNKYINFQLCKEKQQQLECGLHVIKKKTVFREYTRIKSVKLLGQETVYDLNVPGTHNFIADGFIVHNCNLMSVALPKYVETDSNKKPVYNHQLLYDVVRHAVLPMNNIIDFNHYPVPEAELSNKKHRPIGIGLQGLSDVFIKMRLPFESDGAKQLSTEISETIYYAALSGSMELAKKDGAYDTFKGSPMSEGKLQFDLWAEYNGINLTDYLSGRWDWDKLKKDIQQFGVRNSTLTTCMPTASSAQIMGNTESFEPFDSCIFKRRVLSGEYIVANKHLVEDLTRMKLWNKELKDLIIAHNGSIQDIECIPDDIKALYKTVWEIKMKDYIQMAAARNVFLDMTQSMNLFMASPTVKKLTSMLFYTWKSGCKTGMYYLRQKPSSQASKFTIDPEIEKKIKEKQKKGKPLTNKEKDAVLACSIDNRDECTLCSS